MTRTEHELRAIEIGEMFAHSKELGGELYAAQVECARGLQGGGGTNSSTELIERLYNQPFALSRTYDDF